MKWHLPLEISNEAMEVANSWRISRFPILNKPSPPYPSMETSRQPGSAMFGRIGARSQQFLTMSGGQAYRQMDSTFLMDSSTIIAVFRLNTACSRSVHTRWRSRHATDAASSSRSTSGRWTPVLEVHHVLLRWLM